MNLMFLSIDQGLRVLFCAWLVINGEEISQKLQTCIQQISKRKNRMSDLIT